MRAELRSTYMPNIYFRERRYTTYINIEHNNELMNKVFNFMKTFFLFLSVTEKMQQNYSNVECIQLTLSICILLLLLLLLYDLNKQKRAMTHKCHGRLIS